ncbi:MAG: response regulator [Defluviitaleaceae bacterium]|nr:response regulator [Defluviitaleaceae bacterium]
MSNDGIVLLLEDNIKILNLNRRMLEGEGLMVLVAKTIAEARERLKLAIPDVAVLDIMLPDGSGIDFLSELRQTCGNVPVLFLTAKAERADILAGLVAGGNDYISKPYDIDEFRARIMGFIRLVSCDRASSAASKNASLLSVSELSVALFATKGMSNKEIAEKVYLSESRVKTCLSSVYRKLGIADEQDKRRMLVDRLEV